jgi:hypothetical protein
LYKRAVAAGAALGVIERRHGVAHDAQVVLPQDLTLGLGDAKQLAVAGSSIAREELDRAMESLVRERAYRVFA